MDKQTILTEIAQIMKEYFDDEGLTLTPETTAQDVAGWDSLNHVNIVAAVEQHFKIRFLMAEVEGLHRVGDLVDLVAAKLAKT